MTCLVCKHGAAKKHGKWGRTGVQRCTNCRATFSESRLKALGRHYTPFDKAAKIVDLLNEGMSVRAVSRVMDVTQGTILSLLLTAADNSLRVHDQNVRGVCPRFIQCDELWTFVHAKRAHLAWDVPDAWGDAHMAARQREQADHLVPRREAIPMATLTPSWLIYRDGWRVSPKSRRTAWTLTLRLCLRTSALVFRLRS
jgi:transposase-like protein